MPLSKSSLASTVVHMSCLNFCIFAGPQHFMCRILEEMGNWRSRELLGSWKLPVQGKVKLC